MVLLPGLFVHHHASVGLPNTIIPDKERILTAYVPTPSSIERGINRNIRVVRFASSEYEVRLPFCLLAKLSNMTRVTDDSAFRMPGMACFESGGLVLLFEGGRAEQASTKRN